MRARLAAIAIVLVVTGCSPSVAALAPTTRAQSANTETARASQVPSQSSAPALPDLRQLPSGWRMMPADDDSLAFGVPPYFMGLSVNMVSGPDAIAEGWIDYTFDTRSQYPSRMTVAVAGWPPDGAHVALIDLSAWSKRKLDGELTGERDVHILSTKAMNLPLGPAIRYTLWLRNNEGTYHLILYHIWTPEGIVHFSTGAYGDQWARCESDFNVMPWTLRLGSAKAPSPAA